MGMQRKRKKLNINLIIQRNPFPITIALKNRNKTNIGLNVQNVQNVFGKNEQNETMYTQKNRDKYCNKQIIINKKTVPAQ